MAGNILPLFPYVFSVSENPTISGIFPYVFSNSTSSQFENLSVIVSDVLNFDSHSTVEVAVPISELLRFISLVGDSPFLDILQSKLFVSDGYDGVAVLISSITDNLVLNAPTFCNIFPFIGFSIVSFTDDILIFDFVELLSFDSILESLSNAYFIFFDIPFFNDDIYTVYGKWFINNINFNSNFIDIVFPYSGIFDTLNIFSYTSKINISSSLRESFFIFDILEKFINSFIRDKFNVTSYLSFFLPTVFVDIISLYDNFKLGIFNEFISNFYFSDTNSFLLGLILDDIFSVKSVFSSFLNSLFYISDFFSYCDFIDIVYKVGYALFLSSVLSNKKVFLSCHSYYGITGIDKQVVTKDDGVYIFSDEIEKGDLIVNLSDVSSYRLKRIDKVLSPIDIEKAYINVDGRKYEYFGGKVIGFGKGLWGTDLKLALFGIDSLDLLTLRIVEGRRSK